MGRRGWRSSPCPILRLHLWEVSALFIPFIHRPDKWVNICVAATHIALISLYPSRDINTSLWNCPPTCRKPSCLSHVCLQMTTARVRVTPMTGSKVSDHSVHEQQIGATLLFPLSCFLGDVLQELLSFVFNKWTCMTRTNHGIVTLPYKRIISRRISHV